MRLCPGRLFAPLDLSDRRTVLVAVSGGSDSTALLHLIKSFADERDLRVVAATVDHGLRAASAGEARQVAAECAALGIEHRTLQWTGEKPSAGVQAAARLARYRLLSEAAQDAATDLVLLGHTEDDQRETVAMRRARSDPGGRGDAGMARATLYDERTWFARPLLDVSRADLRQWLADRGIGWLEDPSNVDRRFERVRVRQEKPGAQADAAHRLSENALAAALLATVIQPSPGLFRAGAGLATAPGGVTALRMLLAVIGGTEHLPDEERARMLASRLGAPRLRATLSRTVVDRRGEAVWLYRESRGLPAPARLAADAIWDGRYRLGGDQVAGMTVAPLGASAREVDISVPAGASQALVRAALAAQPALDAGSRSAPVPVLADAVPLLGPWRTFLPGFDLAPANALRAVLGLPNLPPSPWRDHNRARP